MLLVLCALLQISPQGEPLLAAPVLLPAPPPAIGLTRNSHATAVAWVAKYLGAARPGEPDETLVAAAWVCIRGCPTCEGNQSPAWDISHGLALLLADRGRASAVTEAYRCSPEGGELATPARVEAALKAGDGVIVTLCSDRTAAIPAIAAQRKSNCFSVAVIGVAEVAGKPYLIARDGLLAEGEEARRWRVAATDLQLPGGGPWGDLGTGIYAWQDGNTNVVLTVVTLNGR